MVSNVSTNNHWWLVGFAATLILSLGAYGFYQHALNSPEITASIPDAIYQSLQLFTMEFTAPSRPFPLELEIARWLAPAVTFFAAIKGILSLLRTKSKTLLGLRNIEQHAIVCGLSNKGYQIAKELIEKETRVVIIDKESQHQKLSSLIEQGAISITDDAQDAALLKQVRLDNARYLFAVTHDDTANINITHEAQQIKTTSTTQNTTLDCYTHVADDTIKTLFYNHPLFSKSEARFNAQLFNLYYRGARLLFDRYPPDAIKTGNEKSDTDKPLSILIFGYSPLTSSLIIHAAMTGHYTVSDKLAIQLVDENASGHIGEIKALFPALEDIIDLSAIDESLDKVSSTRLRSLLDERPSVVYVTSSDDTQSISLAQRLQTLANTTCTTIVACLIQNCIVTNLLRETETSQAENTHFFPLVESTSSLEQILNAQQDQVARVIHEMYCEKQFSLGETVDINPSLIPWDSLSENMKDSNRNQADHLPIKLRAIGTTLEKVVENQNTLNFTEAQITQLAEMEHRRWMAGKRLDGWQTTDGDKDNELKLNPLLIDYDQLPENEKQKDIETITGIPQLIELIKSYNKKS